ncbi:hypothetical protein NL449_27375, partial [Klebsiella pneumoniae]|nr:hypothetical protein [Klebsiella pneumoniae]
LFSSPAPVLRFYFIYLATTSPARYLDFSVSERSNRAEWATLLMISLEEGKKCVIGGIGAETRAESNDNDLC